MSLTLSGTGPLTLPSGSTLTAGPSAGDNTNQIATSASANVDGAVVGSVRGLRAYLSAAGTSLTYTAKEVVLETALGGAPARRANVTLNFNGSTTGANGMDTGALPASGYVALYHIYNPTTQTDAILGWNATSAVAGEVYGGANMPSGYTMSALVGVWPTNGSSQLVSGFQNDRELYVIPTQVISSSTQQSSFTLLSISAAVPKNAKTVGIVQSAAVSANGYSFDIAGDASGIGNQDFTVNATSTQGISFKGVPLISAQTVYYKIQSAGTLSSFIMNVTSYTI